MTLSKILLSAALGALMTTVPGCDCGKAPDLRTLRGGSSKGACSRAEDTLRRCLGKPGRDRHIACAPELGRRIEECD